MDVLNRKLFATREARNRLRNMGGIMASYPELMEEAQKFQAGGPVRIPRDMSFGQIPVMTPSRSFPPVTRPVPALPSDTANMGAVRVADLSPLRSLEMTPEQREYFETLTPEQQRNVLDFGVPDPTPREAFEFETFAPDPLRPPMSIPEAIQRIEEFEAGAGPNIREVVTGSDVEPLERGPSRRALDSRRTRGEDRGARADEEGPAPEETTTDAPTPFDPRLLPDPGGESEETLSELYPRRLEEFKRILGTENDQTAQDKAMQLAMIGLAIAAGQSPDAITNIAQGALAGLQSMSEQEAQRRAQDRELRATALESAMEEVELGKRLRSAENIAAMRTGTTSGTYTPERLYQTNLGAILANPDMFDVFDPTGNFVDPAKARTLARDLSARGELLGGTSSSSSAIETLTEEERRLLGFEE